MATITWKWARKAARWAMAGCVALGGFVAARAAADTPQVTIMLRYKPTQDGVVYTIPKPEEEAGLKVESVQRNGGNGWLLKDAAGKPLRLFFNTNPTPTHNVPDVWAYYKDGVEVYREFESDTKTYTGKPDQFRWLNGGGMKWGVDEAKDGHIKRWKSISPEEVSQEILQALANKDFGRLQALMITDAEMAQLGLPADEVARIRQLEKTAAEKFQKTIADLPKLASGKPNWVHLEASAPECTPAEQIGARADVVQYPHASILFEVGGATDWVQTGEMIQVGAAWRIIEAPTAGAGAVVEQTGPSDPNKVDTDPKVMALVNELTKLDEAAPPSGTPPNPALAKHHLARTDLLEKIAAESKPEQREPWVRQMADSLSTAAQNSAPGDAAAMTRLQALEQTLAKAAPGGDLAAYATYREMQADYAVRITKGDYAKSQAEWVDRLTKFVEAYPKAEDAPDALLQLGMVNEFLNKEVEAKNWYGVLVKNFPTAPQATKATGAIARLDLEGKPLKLTCPTLNDPQTIYNIEQSIGKVVVVYYWASWNSQSAGDFSKLKMVADAEGKGVEIVCVNLDNAVKDAHDFLATAPQVGVHLYQSGGLDSKPAADYGVMVLPNLFLVGKDGKVVNRNVQINNLDDEVKKQLAK
ncbi:MAG TPA: thioredoxin-like domain-containing protein [Gemmataceae bacterium]|nr:thioredoxin-like domain-containing protein [Gemmataceae bacterium]